MHRHLHFPALVVQTVSKTSACNQNSAVSSDKYFCGDLMSAWSWIWAACRAKRAGIQSVSMCTLSLDWISRDFLLAKTCRWLETWRKTGRRTEDGRKRERKKKRGCDYGGKGRVVSAGTHLDAGLVFSYPLTRQNLNVTRHLWKQGYPHEKTHRVIEPFEIATVHLLAFDKGGGGDHLFTTKYKNKAKAQTADPQ